MSNGKLTAILLNLHKSRRSGILRVENKTDKKQIVFDEGRIAFAESNLPGEHLAKIMTEQKLLPVARLREVAAAMKKGRTGEDALLETPGVKTQDVAKGITEQALVIMASLWRWTGCSINFYAGENLIPRKIKASLSPPDVIISSARYAVAKSLYAAPRGFLEGRFEVVEALAVGAGEIPFNDNEAAILVNLKKPLNTMSLLTQANSQSGNTEDSILSLAAIGLIHFQSPDEILMNAADPYAMVLMLENELRRIETSNLYDILLVQRDVSADALQQAYHRMAKQFHPDLFPSRDFSEEIRMKAQKAFTTINEAYFVLKDPVARETYNKKLFGSAD